MGFPRLIYSGGSGVVDFPEGLSEFLWKPVRRAALTLSDGGAVETVRTLATEEVEISVDGCASDAFLRALAGWWAWASRGLPYSFGLDSDTGGLVAKTINATVAAGATVISLNSVTGIPAFSPERQYVLRSADRLRREIVNVDSVDPFASDVTLTAPTAYAYASGDSFISLGHFPTAYSLDHEAPFVEGPGLLFNLRHRFIEAS